MNINDLKEVRYDKAIALRDADKVDEALEAMQALLADFPDYALAQLAIAALYAKKGCRKPRFPPRSRPVISIRKTRSSTRRSVPWRSKPVTIKRPRRR